MTDPKIATSLEAEAVQEHQAKEQAELERIRAARVSFEGLPSWVQVEVTASDPEQRARAVESIQKGQEALSVLREVEWAPSMTMDLHEMGEEHDRCPKCLAKRRDGHAPGCRLAALLRNEVGEERIARALKAFDSKEPA